MSKTDEMISKLEHFLHNGAILRLIAGSHRNSLLNKYYHELESELSQLKEQIKKEEIILTGADNYGQDKGIKLEIEAQKQNKVFDFVVRHKIDCYNAFKLSISHEGYKKPEGKKLIELARKEIGYSVKTWSGDIYSSLYNTYKSIVVDGKNGTITNPSVQPDLDCGIYEEIITYFNNHSNGYLRSNNNLTMIQEPNMPAMSRNAVIEFAKWMINKMKL
jgi:hypothetical protein